MKILLDECVSRPMRQFLAGRKFSIPELSTNDYRRIQAAAKTQPREFRRLEIP